MRTDSVVPLGEDLAGRQPHPRLLLPLDPPPTGVVAVVQTRPTMEARARSRSADVLQHHLVAGQRLARPVAADQAEHPVVYRVPLRCPSRVMRYRDGQPELIR